MISSFTNDKINSSDINFYFKIQNKQNETMYQDENYEEGPFNPR